LACVLMPSPSPSKIESGAPMLRSDSPRGPLMTRPLDVSSTLGRFVSGLGEGVTSALRYSTGVGDVWPAATARCWSAKADRSSYWTADRICSASDFSSSLEMDVRSAGVASQLRSQCFES